MLTSFTDAKTNLNGQMNWKMGAKVSNMTEDIEHTIIDLGDLLETKSHEEILEYLKEKQVQLGNYNCLTIYLDNICRLYTLFI